MHDVFLTDSKGLPLPTPKTRRLSITSPLPVSSRLSLHHNTIKLLPGAEGTCQYAIPGKFHT
jgi:hypothetical protein